MPHAGRARIAALTILLSTLLTGCARPIASAVDPGPATNQVDLPPSYVFRPDAIQVAPDTTVTWTNHDNFTHSVQVQGQSDVHVMKPGESARITFDQPGTYAYVCTFHTQNMRGTVLVRGT
jgi:plastocyanin